MTRNIEFVPNEFYHLYNRGTEKRKIFMNKSDYDRFLTLLHLCNNIAPFHMDSFPRGSTSQELFTKLDPIESLVDIGAYCLMPNHFHLLVREKVERGISKFMQKVMTGFTMYFNTRYERTGALFQGKYKASHVEGNRYLKYLLSYIHLNPVKLIEPKWKQTGISNRLRAEKFLEDYNYSSFIDYCGKQRHVNSILNTKIIKECYDDIKPLSFKQSVTEWLNFKPQV